MTAPGATKRARILAHLAKHPGQTAYEICLGLGYRRRDRSAAVLTVAKLLRDMKRKGQLVTTTEWRPQQGRHVYLWHVAPPGTTPPSAPAASLTDVKRVQARNRANQRRLRARRRGTAAPAVWNLPGIPACRDSDPAVFFPAPGESAEPARAICAGCAVQAECLTLARANGERFGIWGGVDLEAEAGAVRPA